MKFERSYTVDLSLMERSNKNTVSFEEMARHAAYGMVMDEFIKQNSLPPLFYAEADYVEFHKRTNNAYERMVPYMHEVDGLKVNPEIRECGIKFVIKRKATDLLPYTYKVDGETMTVSISDDTDNWEFGRQTI